VMITVSLEPKWRHFAQVNIADIFMLSSKLPKQNEINSISFFHLFSCFPTDQIITRFRQITSHVNEC